MLKRVYQFNSILFVLIMTFSLAGLAEEKVFCSLCMNEITGAHVKFKDGEHFCNECMKKTKCIQCGKPTDMLLDGQPLCVKCQQNPNKCEVCGKLLGRKFIVFPLSDGRYCSECVEKYPKCRFCSAPTNGRSNSGQSWAMCKHCKEKAVHGVADIKEILGEVEDIILSNLHLSLSSPAALEVCEDIVREGRGMNGDEMGLMQQHGSTSVILIQDGLPIEVVYETLAHEWAHAWVAQNAHYQLSINNEEGFCQWVASKVLIAKGYDASLSILRSRVDLYGSGYRKMEKLEISRGSAGVIEFIQNTKPGFFKKVFGKRK